MPDWTVSSLPAANMPAYLCRGMPEGPQSEALAADIASALEADPEAASFFDGLATFYRKKYLLWIDATRRSPEVRAQRIAELVELMKAGKKERPR